MGRPKEHDDNTRTALLAAAEQMIETLGPDALSVRAVAEAVGTTTRAVYSVFGSKDGLLAALATRLFEMLAEAIDACPTTKDPIHDVVTISVDGFRRTALDHQALYALVFLRIVPDLQLGTEFNEAASSAFSRLESQLTRLKAGGELGPMTTHNAARSVHALTEGLATMELRGMLDTATDAEQVWRHAVRALVTGFASSETTPRRRSRV
jgi:AcrR family transcriptional regulator